MFSVIHPYKNQPSEAVLALASPVASFNKMNKASRRKFIRWGLIAGNVLLLLVVALFIVLNRSASQTVRANTLSGAVSAAGSNTALNPLDTLSSSQIALTAAELSHMPELTAIRNQADSDSLELNVPPSDTSILAKPQLVSLSGKSRQDIVHYTTVSGDTVASISKKFKVSADSIRWSNNISGNSLAPGIKLSIPPFNGIVYTVKSGDTLAGLASRFSADESEVIEVNDAEIGGIHPGEQILIPNGKVAQVVTYSPGYGGSISTLSGFTAVYGGNGYDFGTCTWYVASQIPVPSNWGNADTWALAAAASGWTVSSVPRVGAIAQTSGMSYFGHVAIVTAVSADGSQIMYKDMNDPYWDVVTSHGWAPASTYEHYIYR